MKWKNLKKRLLCAVMAGIMVFGGTMPLNAAISENSASYTGKTPKYIFLFIGDGMSYSQLSVTSAYLGAVRGKVQSMDLNVTRFPVTGSAATYDSTPFAPYSASTATSYATGKKTLSGVINMNEKKDQKYETITEKLKKQSGYKIGVISSVNLNPATPAAFYAHTGVPVPVFAMGTGQELFKGFYDNTKVYYNLRALTNVE